MTERTEAVDCPIVIDESRGFVLPEMPAAVRRMYQTGSVEVQGYLLRLLADRGVGYVEAHLGLLQSQADFINAL